MALDVKVKIDLAMPIGSVGFGVPLILEIGATKTIDFQKVNNITAVKNAGFAETSTVYKAAKALFMQNEAPATIAVCAINESVTSWLENIDNLNKGWRQLIVVGNDVPVADISASIELTKDKLYFADLDIESEVPFTINGIERTVLVYCKATEDYPSPAAAVVGATAGKLTGSINYKNMIIKGIEPQDLTDTQIDDIHAKGGMTILLKAGDIVTSMGKVAGGQYIDLRDAIDYVISNIEYKTQKTLNVNDKIKFDDTGIAILESVCVSVMRDAYLRGIIATDENGEPMYTVNYATRAQCEPGDRAVRHYKGGQFAFTCAGAVDTVDVVGELSV